jgi:hypothetical protein
VYAGDVQDGGVGQMLLGGQFAVSLALDHQHRDTRRYIQFLAFYPAWASAR